MEKIDGVDGNKKITFKNYIKIREQVTKEFEGRCGYCGSKLGITDSGNMDNFLPKSLYPNLEYELSNLVLSCNYCNRIKGNKSPIDNDGKKIILNPKIDKFKDHIQQIGTGLVVGITELGNSTIEFFQLNRKGLIEDRLNRTILTLMQNESYKSIEPIINSEKSPYENFSESIKYIEELLKIKIPENTLQNYYYRLLYANVIASLETYLSDCFINKTISSQTYLRKFVETFHDFKNMKFDYSEIYTKHEDVETYVTKTLLDILYHNVAKVKGMYKETLDISFPEDLTKTMYKAVSIRHDIVHRNGKDKDKNEHVIEISHVNELIKNVYSFVSHIDSQIR